MSRFDEENRARDVLSQTPTTYRRVAAGHDRRAVPGALLAAGDARPDEEEAFLAEVLSATDRVVVVRVAAVDDDVAGFKERQLRTGMGRADRESMVDSGCGVGQHVEGWYDEGDSAKAQLSRNEL